VTTKNTEPRFSTLYIRPEAMKRIMYYAEAADGEVSGLGTISKSGKRIVVDKVFLLEQESSSGDTELDPEAISKLMGEMIKNNEDPAKLKFWWHSHGNMGVFWSGTDDECAETLSKEYAFSLVVNKDREIRCRLDLHSPFRLTIDHIKMREISEENPTLKEECKKEVDEKVKSMRTYYYNRYDNDKFGSKWNNNMEKIDIRESQVKDVERFLECAERTQSCGGAYSKECLDIYIKETIKEIVKERFEEKSKCTTFGTFENDSTFCGECKVGKVCKNWTEKWEKQDDEYEYEIGDEIREEAQKIRKGIE